MLKNILIAVLGIAVIVMLAFIFYSPAEKGGMTMTIKTISEKDRFFDIKAEYPQFKNADESFNQKISDLIQDNIEEFKKAGQDNWQARKDTATAEFPVGEYPESPFDFIATWKSDQINEKYISLYISIYSFSGGAHGDQATYSFSYDAGNKKEITVQDVLKSQEMLNKVSELAKTNLEYQYQAKGITVDESINQMIAEGISAKYDNFKTFTFNANSMTFYFQKYQVGPGAAGEFSFVLYNSMLGEEKIGYME